MSKIFFTSDSHFYHKNVLKFENRPFDNVEDMNNGLIKAWNDVVGHDDIVYNLGDMVFGGITKWREILPQLNGKLRLIRGNHDDSKVVKKLNKEGYFDEFHDVGCYIKHNKQCMWLTHYPMEIGVRPMKWSVSGHIHSESSSYINQINVGVDSPLNFDRPFGQPILLEELLEYMEHCSDKIEEEFQRNRNNSHTDVKFGHLSPKEERKREEVYLEAMNRANSKFGADISYFGLDGDLELFNQIKILGYDPEDILYHTNLATMKGEN